jgi:diguanylate cyclase
MLATPQPAPGDAGPWTRQRARIRATLPIGRSLPDETWASRHVVVTCVLWAHAVVLAVVGGVADGLPGLALTAPLLLAAVLAGREELGRRTRELVSVVGLVGASMVAMALSDGHVLVHLDLFVVLGLIVLYQTWAAYTVAIGLAAAHRVLLAVLVPEALYGDAGAVDHPVRWAVVEITFLVAASVTHLAAWRFGEHQAFTDPLTGLGNRVLLVNRLEHALAHARRRGGSVGLLYVDLDDFKALNARYGHGGGDGVLVEVADRLRRACRDSDTACRVGGDEFAVLLEHVHGIAEAARVAERVLSAVREPVQASGRTIDVHVSVGVAITGPDDDGATLLRDADAAMFAAKAGGKDRAQLYLAAGSTASRSSMRSDIGGALERGEIFVEYLGVHDLRDGTVCGVEALVRWRHPVHGDIPPEEFLPLAERMGAIVPIGRYVITQACRAAAGWVADLPRSRHFRLTVNLSATELRRAGLVDDVLEILHETGLRAEHLAIDVSEGAVVANPAAAAERLGMLRSLGVEVAVDDFGTGDSSLRYLRELPVDVVKVDRSHVEVVTDGGQGEALTRAIIELSRALGFAVVAEGVETPGQVAWLAEHGCRHGQGWAFSRPVDASAVPALLRAPAALPAPAPPA